LDLHAEFAQYKDARYLTNIQIDKEFQALPESMITFQKNIFRRNNEFKKKAPKQEKFHFFCYLSIEGMFIVLNFFQYMNGRKEINI
jgi:hypothetical protein